MKVKYSRSRHNTKQTSFTSPMGARRQYGEQEHAQYCTNPDVTSAWSCCRPENVSILSSLLSRHTCPVRSPSLCAQGKLLFYTFLTRNKGTTDELKKRLGCYPQEQLNLPREYFVSDGPQCIVNRELKNHDDDFVDDDRKWDTVHCASAVNKFRCRDVVDDAKHSRITSSCNPHASGGITPCF